MLPALIILGFFIFVYSWLQATKQVVKPQMPEEQTWAVQSVAVQQVDVQPLEQAFGTVLAAREAHLRFGVAGEVDLVSDNLRNGADVKMGDMLATLDTERLQLALDKVDVKIKAETTQIREFTDQLALRQRMAKRAQALFDKGVGSQADLDGTELSVSQASNQLAMAKSNLAELKVSQRRHRKDLEDAVLKAPFDGSVSGVDLALGNQVSNTYLVATLTDLSSLEVSFVVPADIYANVTNLIGQQVSLSWSSEGSVVSETTATITRAEVVVDRTEGGGRLYAELPDDAARSVPPGAFVEVSYFGRVLTNVIELPEEALVGRDQVFVIEQGRASQRQVVLLHRSPGLIWVRGDLNNGDKVIATRLPGIGNGLRVRTVTSAE
ncbi:MAG: efflux RND transporter periplasmic adaptor subunit [Alphaproteobacteria bacterium]|nr:efflux RND transporter periplasmic adaptor subunit [Alphaproteobacteria bacterium]